MTATRNLDIAVISVFGWLQNIRTPLADKSDTACRHVIYRNATNSVNSGHFPGILFTSFLGDADIAIGFDKSYL